VLEVGLAERERGQRVLLLWQFVRVRREGGKSFYLYRWKSCLLVRDLFFLICSIRSGLTGFYIKKPKTEPNRDFSKYSNWFNRFFFSVLVFRLIFCRFSWFIWFIGFFEHPYSAGTGTLLSGTLEAPFSSTAP